MSETPKTRKVVEPVQGMTVQRKGERVEIGYEGYGDGLLIHQAHLADKIVERALEELGPES